ncbi:MAG: type II secretion system protein [Thiobacillus sp.]
MNKQLGFSLIELAIVLVIVTLLVGGLAMPLSAQIQARRIAETRADMDVINDALIGYAMSHTFAHSSGAIRHFLPCPDVGAGAPGVETPRNPLTGQCASERGMLPWRTLGVKGQDALGNRYTYGVTAAFSNNLEGFASTPTSSATSGTLNVFPDASCSSPSVAAGVPVVVVSHGPNGRGATNVNGGTPLAATDLSDAERHNLVASSPTAPCDLRSFISTTPSDTFDDLVIWLSAEALFNRVCPDGGCL